MIQSEKASEQAQHEDFDRGDALASAPWGCYIQSAAGRSRCGLFGRASMGDSPTRKSSRKGA